MHVTDCNAGKPKDNSVGKIWLKDSIKNEIIFTESGKADCFNAYISKDSACFFANQDVRPFSAQA